MSKIQRYMSVSLDGNEYSVHVQPSAPSAGRALFGQLATRHLDLVEATPFSSGVVLQLYRGPVELEA